MSLGRVLVVDDESNMRKAVRMTLRKAGYDVIEAEDGDKGIAAMKSGDNGLMLDAIICDMHMPNMDGKQAIAYFKSEFPSVPIIVLTGHPHFQDARNLIKDGVMDYVAKPFEPAALVSAVAKAVESHTFHS